jgi:hypothetical protein
MAVKFAEFPQRKCREQFMVQEHVDLSCDLPEGHPGPPASRSSVLSIERRERWESEHEGWEQMARNDDPFQGIPGA